MKRSFIIAFIVSILTTSTAMAEEKKTSVITAETEQLLASLLHDDGRLEEAVTKIQETRRQRVHLGAISTRGHDRNPKTVALDN